MLSFIDVTCPHCSASGKIIMPPPGSVVIGPCPRCGKPVVLFHGWALPLDSGIMESGNVENIRRHVKEVLNRFISDRVDRLIDFMASNRPTQKDEETVGESAPGLDDTGVPKSPNENNSDDVTILQAMVMRFRKQMGRARHRAKDEKITDQEVQQFVQEELNKIDDSDYFKSIFG